jgi:hypothetical protein
MVNHPSFEREALNIQRKKNFCHKDNLVQDFAQKHNHHKKASQKGFHGRLQDYE